MPNKKKQELAERLQQHATMLRAELREADGGPVTLLPELVNILATDFQGTASLLTLEARYEDG